MRSLYRLPEAAEYLGIHPRTLRCWIADGVIGWVRVGERGVRFTQQNLDDYVAAHAVPAAAPRNVAV